MHHLQIHLVYRLEHSSCRLLNPGLVQACDDKKHFAWRHPSEDGVGGKTSEPPRPLPPLEQRLAAWRCGCPARRAHATANIETPYSTYHPTPSPCSPCLISATVGRRMVTQDDSEPQPHEPARQLVAFSVFSVWSSGQWNGRSSHHQTALPIIALSANQRIGSVRDGKDMVEEGGWGAGRRKGTMQCTLTRASPLYLPVLPVPHACSHLVPHCHRQHTQ